MVNFNIGKILAFVFVGGIIFIAVPVLSVLFGMLAGWVTGLFFSDMLLPMFKGTFLEGYSLAYIGGFLGFIGAFFKTSYTSSK